MQSSTVVEEINVEFSYPFTSQLFVSAHQSRLGWVRSSQVRLGKVKSGQVM